jgi:hypothetical protein
MKQTHPSTYMIVAFILACGLALSGYLLSFTIYRSQVANDTVSVKGLAEKEVQADWAQVDVYFTREELLSKQEYDTTGHHKIIAKLYRQIDSDRKIIENSFRSLGFLKTEISDIELYPDSKDFRGEDGKHTDTKITVRGKLTIESKQVFAIQKLDSAMSNLMSKGITVATGQEKYHFSKLNDIKPEMIRKAMAAARVAAKELAGNTGVKLGRIKSANQGRFSIVDKGEDYGDTDRIDKKVRVVTEIKFYLDS